MKESLLIFLVVLCFQKNSFAQTTFEIYGNQFMYIPYTAKPMLSEKSKENQYCIQLNGNDTLEMYRQSQVFNYGNREVKIVYDIDGTLSGVHQTVFRDDTTILSTIREIDEEGVFDWKEIKIYNDKAHLKSCKSVAFENDTLYSTIHEFYVYNQYDQLSKVLKYDDSTLMKTDTFIYDFQKKLREIITNNIQGDFKQVVKYKYTQNEKYVQTMSVYIDSVLVGQTFFPEGNQYYADSIVVRKNYRDPEKSRRYAVETLKITTSNVNEVKKVKKEKYHDHELILTQVYKYNSDHKIVLYQRIDPKRKNRAEKRFIYEKLYPEDY